jgi:Met-zincin
MLTTSSRFSKLSPLTLILAVTAAGAAASLASCAGQGDVDRTQPDKVGKSILLDAAGAPKTFYFRQTYVGVPQTSNWAFEGTQTEMQKIRFAIEEKFLKGYRAFDYAPGSENPFTGGANNTDAPLLVYAIKSHFDVKREYNPGTGEQTNVISENTTDRPWDQREFMRVDWSTNLAEPDVDSATYDPETMLPPVLTTHNYSYFAETTIEDPAFKDRPIMTDGYMDFVQRVIKTPDYGACLTVYPWVDDGGPWNCGAAEITIRNSFREVKPSSYEAVDYRDNYPILDKNGNPIQLLPDGRPCNASTLQTTGGSYSGADCAPAQVGAFSKFGFFRTVVQTYDRNYGATEAGRKYYANRWNIWDNVDADGNSVFDNGKLRQVPLNKRKPKPIVYYTNIEFPDDPTLFDQAKQVTADWSNALKKTVAGMLATEGQPTGVIPAATIDAKAASQPEMVVLRRNSCYLAPPPAAGATKEPDFRDYLNGNPDIADRVQTATGLGPDELDKAHLAQACSVAEAATEKLPDGDAKKFMWQRNGDLRYSFFHWVDRPAPAGPLGYGPSSADPQTGEIISASLYNYGAALDTYAQMSADAVELINNQISPDDLLSGKTIADVLKATSQARQLRDAQPLTPEARARATAMLQRGSTTPGKPRLIPIPGGAAGSKLDMIKGTALEREIMTPDILAAMLPESKPGDTLTPAQFAQASPANWLSPKARDQRLNRFKALATNGCVFLGEFADDAILGLALELKKQGLSGDALFHSLRTLIFRGLADHEMGHTMGLRHNFSGSTDALNYNDNFWKIRTGMAADKWDENKLSEYEYSTVMDYGSRFNSDVHGLGKYDLAAIRFGYGGLVDIMPAGAMSTGDQLANDIFVNDYSKLPDEVGGVKNLADGGVQRYSSIIANLSQAYQTQDLSKGGFFVTQERPFKFCSDEYVGNLDCKPWDFGANQREIVGDTIDRFKNYFVFNAFKRGRLTWSINAYLNRLLERYFSRYTEAYQFYYFYGGLLGDSDLGQDLLKASIDSLNALGEIMQTPEPGEHCTTANSPDVMVLPATTGPNACQSGSLSMNIQIPDGKPYYINFSPDYYYRITRAGSLYEKLGALIAMTSTEARFYRVDTFADSSKYSINYYSIFKDEMLNLLSGVIRDDSGSYGGYVPVSGAMKGQYQPTPIVDPATFGQVKPLMPAYMQPGVKRVETPVNKTIRYYALLLSLGNLDSSWDSTLDMSNYLAVTLKGSKEDVTYSPGTTVLEYEQPQTGQVYRAPVLDAARPSIAAKVVKELVDITGKAGTPGTLPTSFGSYRDLDNNIQSLPDWQTAKANMDAAKVDGAANTDATKAADFQRKYDLAQAIFQQVDYYVSYRVDLINDLRLFRSAFGY